ncbi:MAG: 4Fe-4S dicluster domain-containing protein [Methanocellales archaeon]|nr:4Fe-4S dicluster domain-containing protein [Methanocellales archaeon]
MPKKYSIAGSAAPPRFQPVGKFVIERNEDECIHCGRCTLVCLHDVHKRRGDDPRFISEPVNYLCKGCFRCIQECPKEALTIKNNEEWLLLGDSYWTPETFGKIWYQAETGSIPVSGTGYTGPFSGEGFDSMWTDMSEIVRPTRDGIHGREYISTSVYIGRKAQMLTFDNKGKIKSPLPPTLSIPIPLIFDIIPFRFSKNVYESLVKAASFLGTFMIIDLDEWFNSKYQANLVPFFANLSKKMNQKLMFPEFEGVIKKCKMVEIAYDLEVLKVVEEIKRLKNEMIVSVRIPFGDSTNKIVEELAFAGVEVLHLCADVNGKVISSSDKNRFVKDGILDAHRLLVEHKIRDEVTLMLSGGIAMAEHVAKAIICGADVTAVDLPLLIALECRYCKRCQNGLSCPVELKALNSDYGAQRIINLMRAWRNQLLEVLGAMGLRDVRRLRGEVGRAILHEDIRHETFEKILRSEGVTNNIKSSN